MKLLKILAVLLLIAITVACTSSRKGGSNASMQGRPLSSLTTEQQKNYVNAKLLAESAVNQQRFDLASSNYLVLARLTHSVLFAERAVRFAEKSRDHIASLEAANFWNQIDPEDQTAMAWKILGQLRSHQNTPLQKNLQQLLKLTKNDAPGQFLKIMESIIVEINQPHSFKALETFAQHNPNEPEPWLVLARLSEKMDDKLTSLALIDKALSLKSNFAPALELKGLIYLRAGKAREAKKQFADSVLINPADTSLRLHLAQIFYQEKNYPETEKLALEILHKDSDSDDARYLLAAVYFLQEKYTQSEDQFIRLLVKNYKLDTVYYFLGEINLEYEKKELALQFFDAVVSGRNITNAHVNSAKILFEKGQLKDALKRLRNVRTSVSREQIYLAITEIEMLEKSSSVDKHRSEIEKSFSRNPANIFLLTRALKIAQNSLKRKQIIKMSITSAQSPQAYRSLVEVAFSVTSQVGDNLLAIELLNDYLKQFPKDLQLLYSRSMLKATVDDMSGMEQDLEEILTIDVGYIDALNALGYSLADQNRDLERAYQMISTAFRQRPKSAAITDSMGWILFRKGELEGSLKHLQTAWEVEPSAEIGAHLGEVLWFSDEKDQAKEIWKQSLLLNPTNKILLETLKRLKVN